MLKDKFKSFFKSKKINVFALFLGLSFCFLLLTKLTRDYTQTVTFKIEKENIPQEQIIVNDTTHSLQITLKTYGFKLLSYLLVKPSVSIDFSKLDKTATNYLWLNKKQHARIVNQFNDNVEVIAINPDTIAFRYDESFVKNVPIVLQNEIKYKAGYDILDAIKLQPDSVKVIGPKVILDSITNIKTKTLRLKDVQANISQNIKLNLSGNEQLNFSVSSTKVTATVDKFTEGAVEVPISVLNIPENISLSFYPKTVKVYFYTSLKDFKTVFADDFKVECDYNVIQNGSQFLTPKVVLKPKSVKNVRLNTNTIEYILKKVD